MAQPVGYRNCVFEYSFWLLVEIFERKKHKTQLNLGLRNVFLFKIICGDGEGRVRLCCLFGTRFLGFVQTHHFPITGIT